MFIKNGVLKILQNLQQKTCDLKLYLKRDSVRGVPFLLKKTLVVASGLFF